MNLTSKNMSKQITPEDFANWLASDNHSPLMGTAYNGWYYVFVKMPYTDTSDLIFSSWWSSVCDPANMSKLELNGLYHRPTNQYITDIYRPAVQGFDCVKKDKVCEKMAYGASVEVAAYVLDHKEEVKSWADDWTKNIVNDYKAYTVIANVLEAYYHPELDVSRKKKTFFSPNGFLWEDIACYLDNPDEFYSAMAIKFIDTNHKELAGHLMCVEIFLESKQEFLSDVPEIHKLIKSIRDAVAKVEAKNMQVTICNDAGEEMTFSYPSQNLLSYPHNDCPFDYAGWHLTSKERKKMLQFLSNENRSAYESDDFRPTDIVRITYKKKLVWSREEK